MRSCVALLVPVIAASLVAPSGAGPYEEGLRRHDNLDETGARLLWRPLAEQGHLGALIALNRLYYSLGGKPLDVISISGRANDIADAARWTRREAEKRGNWRAQIELGVLYLRGQGVPQDQAEAYTWFRTAAAQGGADAMMYLGEMYQTGDSVKQDPAQAEEWYVAAAALGHPAAMFVLGDMYLDGKGTRRDYVKAFMWFSLAATHLPEDERRGEAAMLRDIASLRMTSAQIAEAERLARDWEAE